MASRPDGSHEKLRSLLVQFCAESKAQSEALKKDNAETQAKLLSIIENGMSECKQFTNNQCSNLRAELKSDISVLSDRVSVIEGQDARVSALENIFEKHQNSVKNSDIEPPVAVQIASGHCPKLVCLSKMFSRLLLKIIVTYPLRLLIY